MVEPESIIGQYLLALDRMNTRSDMFDIQFQIIESLIACERGISHANDKPFVLARDFVIPNAPPEAHSPGVGVELLRRKEDLSKALLLQFGDALAWSLFPREFVRGSAQLKKGGYVTFRSVFDAAVESLRVIRDHQTDFAILNDLTRCLGIGDITTIGPTGGRIIEVKSSPPAIEAGMNPRFTRQVERMAWLSEYASIREGPIEPTPGELRAGQTKPTLDGKPVRAMRVQLPMTEAYHHKELEELVERAAGSSQGWASTILEQAPYVIARRESVDPVTIPYGTPREFGGKEGDRILVGVVNRLVWDFPDLLPISAFDTSPSVRATLLSGDIIVSVACPVRKIASRFEDKGYIASYGIDGLTIQKGSEDWTVLVGPYPLARVLYELLSLKSLVELVCGGVDALDRVRYDNTPMKGE